MANQETGSTAAIAAPKDWPGAFALYKLSKEAILVNWQTYLGLLLLTIAFSFIVSAVFGNDVESTQYSIGQLVSGLLSIYITAATTIVFLGSVKRKDVSFNQALSEALGFFLPFIAMTVLVYIALFFSLVLFIIPIFFVAPRLALAPYTLIDKNLGPVEAVKASWEMTKGNVGKVYGIFGVNVLIALLVITIIGIPFAAYFFFMYSAASALLYHWIEQNKKQPETV